MLTINGVHNAQAHPLITHFTCATDSEQLKVVFRAVEDSILQVSLSESDLL